MSDVTVTHNPERHRYEAHLDDALAGFAEYIPAPGLIVFSHTEVDSAYEGRGIGGALARFALDDVRERGDLQVMPLCPFIRSWIDKHPDYADLVYNRPASTVTD